MVLGSALESSITTAYAHVAAGLSTLSQTTVTICHCADKRVLEVLTS